MTFGELDSALGSTGRRSLATRLIFSLADALDDNRSGINLDDFEKQSGFVRTNIRSVASALREQGVLEIVYYDENVSEVDQNPEKNTPRGRWSKQRYRLSDEVLKLLRRA